MANERYIIFGNWDQPDGDGSTAMFRHAGPALRLDPSEDAMTVALDWMAARAFECAILVSLSAEGNCYTDAMHAWGSMPLRYFSGLSNNCSEYYEAVNKLYEKHGIVPYAKRMGVLCG